VWRRGATDTRALRDTYGQDAFPEFSLNALGYALLRGGKVLEAVAAFTLAVDAYPQSANVYGSLGEAYAAAVTPSAPSRATSGRSS